MFGRALSHFSILCALAGPAYGGCDQTFDVDPNKTISSVSVLLAMPEAGVRPISCPAAERFREFLFVKGATKIDDKTFAELKTYQQTMSAQRAVLEKAIKDAEPNPTRILVDIAIMEYGKYVTIIGCAAPEPAMTKTACAIGLGSALLATYDLANNASKANDSLSAAKIGLAAHDALYKKEMDLKDAKGITARQENLKSMYANMCEAIQRNCLK